MTVSSHLYRTLLLSLTLLVSPIGMIAQSQEGGKVQTLDRSASQVAFDQVVSAHRDVERLDLDLIDDLYSQSILSDEGIEVSVARLGDVAANRRESRLARANAYLTIGHLYWRFGDMKAALSAADAGLRRNETFDGMLLKARLQDAQGETEDAQVWYEKAYAAATDDSEREFIRIRLTMINVDDENVNALIDLAGERDQVFQNRAGVALALLGHADDALGLYEILPEDDKIPRRHIRLSEWALVAEDFGRAQTEAWNAYQTASSRADRLYGLALLSEAYRKPDALDRLVELLSAQGLENEELLELRIDILVELGRFQEAIDLYGDIATESEVSVEARQRLISLYDAAGQTEQMIAEYKSLMVSDPQEATWYASLAAQYGFSARVDLAKEVWEQFEKANRDRSSVLISGAEEMVAMGYFDEAVAMIERDMTRNGDNTFALMFLFDKYVDRAQTEEAATMLKRLEQIIAPAAPELIDLADGYERLGLYAEARDVYIGLKETLGELGYDQNMRLAWLYGVVGQKDEALNLWRDIWVSVQSRARRTMAEEQLLLLSAELGKIGDLAVELEEKLYEGSAKDNEIDLLVNLYVQAGDQFSAIEVTEEFARSSTMEQVDLLQRLARVYQELEDHASYDAILRQLYEVDEDNRIEHVQGIILNLLAHNLVNESETRQAEITKWVGELRNFNAEAVSGEFEAGIYSMGGFPEAAIAGYRRAIAENPRAGDNLLLMSELLKDADRTDEAVAMLQYVAEHARDDDLFVIAIDGMINMIGQPAFGSVLSQLDKDRFRWAQRIILERITSRDTQFYLYTLLANIAEELDDREAQFRAIENSLSEAGIRRTSILRELVTLSTANSGFGGFNTGEGDPDRKVQHGRRLVALGQALPPEVYIELGKTLLEQGDAAGAEKALGEIMDVSGLIDIDSTKADMFYEAGYNDRALLFFNRAMVGDQNSYDLIVKTALLREAAGQFDTANALYLRGLELLFTSQAQVLRNPPRSTTGSTVVGPPVDTSVTRDFRTYADTFEQGALLTWPDGPAGDEALAGLEALFDAEIDGVRLLIEEGERQQFAKFARLDRLSRFLVRVHQYQNNEQGVRRIADALFEVFPEDESMAANLISNQLDWAWSPLVDDWRSRVGQSSDYNKGTSVLSGLLAEAAETGDLDNAVQLSKITGDDTLIFTILGNQAREGKTREALPAALELLDDAQFARFYSSIEGQLIGDSKRLLGLYNSPPEIISKLHKRLGRPVATPDELLDALDSMNRNRESISLDLTFIGHLAENGSVEEKLKALSILDSRIQPPGLNQSSLSLGIVQSLLEEELTAVQKVDLLKWIDGALSEAASAEFDGTNTALNLGLYLRAAPGNVDILREVADLSDQYFQTEFGMKSVTEAYFSGNKKKALLDLFELNLENTRGVNPQSLLNRPVLRLADGSSVFAGEFAGVLRDFANGQSFPDPLITSALALGNFSEDERVDLLRRLVSQYPDRNLLAYTFLQNLLLTGQNQEAFELLQDLNSRIDNDALRLAVYTTFMKQGNYTAALSVAKNGDTDLTDPAQRAQMYSNFNRSIGALRGPRSIRPTLLHFLDEAEQNAATSAVRNREPPLMKQSLERLRSALTEGDNLDFAMRGLWRSNMGTGRESGAAVTGNGLASASLRFAGLNVEPTLGELGRFSGVYILGGSDSLSAASPLRTRILNSARSEQPSETLFDAVAEAGASPEEFDRYLRELPVGEIAGTARLYDSLVLAYKTSGKADAKRAELGKELLDGAISHHHFTLWLMLSEDLDQGELNALRKRVSGGLVNRDQLKIAAELAARSDAQELAKDLLVSLVIDQFKSATLEAGADSSAFGGGGSRIGGSELLRVDDIVDIAARLLDPEQAAKFADAVVQLTYNPNGSANYQSMSGAFILNALGRLLPKDEVISYVESNAPSVLDPATANEWLKVELIYANIHGGRSSEATTALRDLLQNPIPLTYLTSGREYREAFGYAEYTDFFFRGVGWAEEVFMAFVIDRFDSDEFKSDQGARDWLESASLEAIELSQEDGVLSDVAMSMASLFAHMLEQSGEAASAGKVLAKAFDVIAKDPSAYRSETVDSLLVVLEALETSPVSADDLKAIAEAGRLDFNTQMAMLHAASENLSANEGVDIAKVAVQKFEGVPVLETALTIAKAAGDRSFERQLNGGLSKLERSRAQLESFLE